MEQTELKLITSNDSIFDDIRPCNDNEVQAELNKIISDDLVLNSILKFQYPVLYKRFSFILKPFVKLYLKQTRTKVICLSQITVTSLLILPLLTLPYICLAVIL